jgi:hypothetical protein
MACTSGLETHPDEPVAIKNNKTTEKSLTLVIDLLIGLEIVS